MDVLEEDVWCCRRCPPSEAQRKPEDGGEDSCLHESAHDNELFKTTEARTKAAVKARDQADELLIAVGYVCGCVGGKIWCEAKLHSGGSQADISISCPRLVLKTHLSIERMSRAVVRYCLSSWVHFEGVLLSWCRSGAGRKQRGQRGGSSALRSAKTSRSRLPLEATTGTAWPLRRHNDMDEAGIRLYMTLWLTGWYTEWYPSMNKGSREATSTKASSCLPPTVHGRQNPRQLLPHRRRKRPRHVYTDHSRIVMCAGRRTSRWPGHAVPLARPGQTDRDRKGRLTPVASAPLLERALQRGHEEIGLERRLLADHIVTTPTTLIPHSPYLPSPFREERLQPNQR